MIEGISGGVSGQAAAQERLQASASNVANIDSRGALPIGGAASGSEAEPQAYQPVAVEQSSNAEGGTVTTERDVRPPYIPVFDTTSRLANEDGLVARPNVDLAQETTEQVDASRQFEANQRTVESISDLVRKLYDLPE